MTSEERTDKAFNEAFGHRWAECQCDHPGDHRLWLLVRDAIEASLAESALKWSKEPPTAAEQAELWWWRKSPHHKAAVQEVFRGEVWEDRGAVRTLAHEWGGEWAGPLTPPAS